MGQIQLTTALIMIGLFSVAIIGFAVNFAEDNNAPVNLTTMPEITTLYSQSETNLSSFNANASSQYQSILETTIAPASGSAQSTGPFEITWKNVYSLVKNIMDVGYTKIFGTDSGFEVFLITFEGLILFMAGLFIYKTLRGMPD